MARMLEMKFFEGDEITILMSLFTMHYLFTLVLKSPDGEWPITLHTYTYLHAFPLNQSTKEILVMIT